MAVLTVEEILDRLQEIADVAEAEARELTEEEVGQIEALEGDLATAQERRAKSDAARERIANARKVSTPALHVKGKPEENADTIDAAFTAYLRTGVVNADLAELRNAQSAGSDSAGGYTVPAGFRQKLVDRMKAFGGIANVVETITTSDGRSLEWPTVDDTSNTGEIVAEGATFAGGADLVFGTKTLAAYSYMAGGASATPLRISKELTQDSAFDIEKLVSDKLGQRLARIQATHLVSGSGSSQPLGIATGTGIEPAAGTGITYADLLNYVHSVDPAYRDSGSCRWAFNDASLEYFRNLLDANDRPLLKADGTGIEGAPGGLTLLGYPVTIDQAFADITLTNGAGVEWGVFGDLNEGYVVRRVRDVEILVNPYARMAYRQIEFSAWARMDATQQNTNAYVICAGFTT